LGGVEQIKDNFMTLVNPHLVNPHQIKKLLVAITMVCASGTAVAGQAPDWQPVSSEKLISLPANYLTQTIESDFLASPLAAQMDALDQSMNEVVTTMHEVKSAIEGVSGEALVELKHQFLQAKSDYLDLMAQKQILDQQAMDTRRTIYEKVLTKVNRANQKANSLEVIELKQAQKNARKRMESAKALVDNALLEAGDGNSEYSNDYAKNMSKLEALKAAINIHTANASPAVDGQQVSKSDFVRHLLTSLNAEQAIFDQEKLMLSYMAKLVAMDAQTLEHQLLASSEEDGTQKAQRARVSLSGTTDLFIGQ
jgi:hypothetical protein